jgi:hypothetical protein
MGLYEAEVRGYTGEEDILTSRVFGTLDVLDRSKFLLPFLQSCDVELPETVNPDSIRFTFWETCGKRTPDVVIRDSSFLLFVENKLGSPVDNQQLRDEYVEGLRLSNGFRLLVVTANHTRPDKVDQAIEQLRGEGFEQPRIAWTNWQQIYSFLRRNRHLGNATEAKVISDLLAFMEAKGLSTFVGFDQTALKNVSELWPSVNGYLGACSAFFGALANRLQGEGISCIENGYVQEIAQFGSRSSLLRDFRTWVPRSIWMRAWDSEWNEKDTGHGFVVSFQMVPLELNAVYRLRVVSKNRNLQERFSERAIAHQLSEKLQSLCDCSMRYLDRGFQLLESIDATQLSDETLRTGIPTETHFVWIGRSFGPDELVSPSLLEDVAKYLMALRDIVKDCDLYLAREQPTDDQVLDEEATEQ